MSSINFDIVTVFPEAFESYLNTSILKRAQTRRLIEVRLHSLRRWGKGSHRQLDDKPYGGGAGMVLMAEPILRAVERARGKGTGERGKVVVLSAKGKQFNQRMAYDWAKRIGRLILISGRYEGIDERVRRVLKADEISIGPYVLTDGDAAAMAIISTVSRLIPGVIKTESLQEESHGNRHAKRAAPREAGSLEYPHYTRPEVLRWKGRRYRVPTILLSGNHERIAAWRAKHRR